MFMYWLLREGGEKCVLSQLEFWAGGGGDGGLEGYVLIYDYVSVLVLWDGAGMSGKEDTERMIYD